LNQTEQLTKRPEDLIMRENTGRQTVTAVNFVDNAHAETQWTPAEADTMQWVIDAYADQARANAEDPEYIAEWGAPFVWEYEEAGLYVTVLGHDGQVDSVWAVTDDDVVRLHTAARTGRRLSIRYVKEGGQVSRRSLSVSSVRLTKAGHITVRATDLKIDEGRSFRADRITHTTLHRATATPAAPSKRALAAAFVPAARPADLFESVSDVYLTTPGTAAALEAPEAVQDRIAERYALGHQFAFITA
jgi:hypothetical protein